MITLAASYYRDSPDREANYKAFVEHWSKYPVTIDIEVCEEFTPLMEVYNRIAKRCQTDLIAFIDIDVYFDYSQLLSAIDRINSGCDFVNPFDNVYDVDGSTITLQEKHQLHGNIVGNVSFTRYARTIGKTINDAPQTKFSWNMDINWNTPFFVGLCVVTTIDTFFEFGMGNENFKVWGGADDEWYARAMKLGYSWTNIPGPIYHRHHANGNVKQKRLARNNMMELYKSISFTKEELRDYISTWSWLK